MNFAQFLLAHEPVMRLSSFVLTSLPMAERMWLAGRSRLTTISLRWRRIWRKPRNLAGPERRVTTGPNNPRALDKAEVSRGCLKTWGGGNMGNIAVSRDLTLGSRLSSRHRVHGVVTVACLYMQRRTGAAHKTETIRGQESN